ncbi:MAG: DUF1573 domain-containing protein [Cytophagaceae bacterium]|nr:DUF1573 domain-containing protein [Cytophagaceae bacterium]
MLTNMNTLMKTFFLICLLGISLAACNSGGEEKKAIYENLEDGEGPADSTAEKPLAVTQITFEEKEHHFGTIDDGMVVSHTFKFKNTGNAPLLISDARPSCGCTVPSFPKEPIMPGAESQIEVKYNSSGKGGRVDSKTVTVIANTDPADNVLVIKADVKAKGASPIKN